MRKLTRMSLEELAMTLPVVENEIQASYVGGGNGTYEDPYTQKEYYSMLAIGSWQGGYVENMGHINGLNQSENPYISQEEYNRMVANGTWEGGLVEGIGYVLPDVVCMGGGKDVTVWDLLTDEGTTITEGTITTVSTIVFGIMNSTSALVMTGVGVAKEVRRKEQISQILDYMREHGLDSVYEIKHDGTMYISPGATMGNSSSVFYNKKTGEIIGSVDW